MVLAPALDRFASDLAAFDIDAAAPFAIAVSGGPDSLALLLLARAARGESVRAVTVDHGLRPEGAAEAAAVAAICARLAIPHATVRANVAPAGEGLQAAARTARYAALAAWCVDGSILTLATAHHADDQAETLLMRLNRGAGLAGLAGIRADRPLAPGVRLVRPLLGWRKAELAAIIAEAGLAAADDPANRDLRHDRTGIRALLAANRGLDSARIARSAHHLADSEAALAWSAAAVLSRRRTIAGDVIRFDPTALPAEIVRRCVVAILADFQAQATGPAVAALITRLQSGQAATLAGIKASPGLFWHFAIAPPRRDQAQTQALSINRSAPTFPGESETQA